VPLISTEETFNGFFSGSSQNVTDSASVQSQKTNKMISCIWQLLKLANKTMGYEMYGSNWLQ